MHQNELNKKRHERDMKDNKSRLIKVPVELSFIVEKDLSKNIDKVNKLVTDLVQSGVEYHSKPFTENKDLEFVSMSVKIHTSYKYFD